MTLFIIIFFFNDTATTEIYTLSLHDALPIFFSLPDSCPSSFLYPSSAAGGGDHVQGPLRSTAWWPRSSCERRSEEHTSELQSRQYLVCRLLLEKKKKNI